MARKRGSSILGIVVLANLTIIAFVAGHPGLLEERHETILLVAICIIVICSILFIIRSIAAFFGNIRAGMKEAEIAHRMRANQCLYCGYSLRGNTTGICPECGINRDLPIDPSKVQS